MPIVTVHRVSHPVSVLRTDCELRDNGQAARGELEEPILTTTRVRLFSPDNCLIRRQSL